MKWSIPDPDAPNTLPAIMFDSRNLLIRFQTDEPPNIPGNSPVADCLAAIIAEVSQTEPMKALVSVVGQRKRHDESRAKTKARREDLEAELAQAVDQAGPDLLETMQRIEGDLAALRDENPNIARALADAEGRARKGVVREAQGVLTRQRTKAMENSLAERKELLGVVAAKLDNDLLSALVANDFRHGVLIGWHVENVMDHLVEQALEQALTQPAKEGG